MVVGDAYLGERGRGDLAVALPALALGGDDVAAKEGEHAVLLERLGEPRAVGRDFLVQTGPKGGKFRCTDALERRKREEETLPTRTASASAT